MFIRMSNLHPSQRILLIHMVNQRSRSNALAARNVIVAYNQAALDARHAFDIKIAERSG